MFLFVVWRSFFYLSKELLVIQLFFVIHRCSMRGYLKYAFVLVFTRCVARVILSVSALAQSINAKPFKTRSAITAHPFFHWQWQRSAFFHHPMLSLRLFVVLSNNVIEFIKNDVMHALNTRSLSLFIKIWNVNFVWVFSFSFSHPSVAHGSQIAISLNRVDLCRFCYLHQLKHANIYTKSVRSGAIELQLESKWHTLVQKTGERFESDDYVVQWKLMHAGARIKIY